MEAQRRFGKALIHRGECDGREGLPRDDPESLGALDTSKTPLASIVALMLAPAMNQCSSTPAIMLPLWMIPPRRRGWQPNSLPSFVFSENA